LIVAIVELALVHTPPVTAFVSVCVIPTHIAGTGTLILPGAGNTVAVVVTLQPVEVAVNVIVVVPGVTPVAKPVLPTIVATAGVELAHVPVVEFNNVDDLPTQRLVGPVIGAGNELIVTALSIEHPVEGIVAVINAVPGVVPATTTPVVGLTEVIRLLVVDHLTPGVVVANVIELPAQMLEEPVIAAGCGLTVTVVFL